jgi:hypothetical protein
MTENTGNHENKENKQKMENAEKIFSNEKLNGESPTSSNPRKDCYGIDINKKEKKHKIMFSEHMVKVVVVENFKKFNIVNDKKNCSCRCDIF